MKKYHYCPLCSTKLAKKKDDGIVRLSCPKDGYTFYNNPRPASSVIIFEKDKILLVKRSRPPFRGYWDIPGGFMEAHETPQETAVREMEEETRLHINIRKLFGLYMDMYLFRGIKFPVLGIYYLAEIAGGIAQPASDVAEIRWFPIHKIPFSRVAFASSKIVLRDFISKARQTSVQELYIQEKR